jgi:hypothetical protein
MMIQASKSMPRPYGAKTALLHTVLVLVMVASCCAFPVSQNNVGPSERTKSVALAAERQPWNVFRFAQQSSRFINLFPEQTKKRVMQRGDILWKAGAGTNDFTFAPLDDVVMGGASSSNFDGATGQWTGQVTDANNGGFIGIRSTPFVEWDMSQCQGIEVKLTTRNSPLRLKVVLRDSTEFNGISWATSTDVVNGKRLKIPFAKQVPTVFAKIVSGQTFSKDQVKGMQLVRLF